ncbi:hypothetical protein K7432_012087 [Basidiobolus ranarum]|uniref:SPIN90/Ldb17 leucine-rich domain-containing protein n=1 Tax=Basidiobolus ranarum TaxID=34480 RepID=A0ABR2VSU0_9FUNG
MRRTDFYDELGALFAKLPSCTEDLECLLKSFLCILQNNEDIVSIGNTLHNVCYSFIELAYFEEHKDIIVEILINLGIQTRSEKELNVIYTVLYFVYQAHPNCCNKDSKRNLLKKLKSETVEEQVYGTQLPGLLLLKEMCCDSNFISSDLVLFDDCFLDSLLDLVGYTDHFVSDAAVDLLLCLVQQFDKGCGDNLAIEAMSRRLRVNPAFSEIIVLTSAAPHKGGHSRNSEICQLLDRLKSLESASKQTPSMSAIHSQSITKTKSVLA